MYEFDEVLLKPHIESLDTYSQRIRRNLIVASIIAYIFTTASNGMDASNSSFAGIQFSNLKPEYIQMLLGLTLLYLLVHFIWASFDHLKENKLRLTGIVIPIAQDGFYHGGDHDLHPNTDQERNSSIFSWWVGEKKKIDGYEKIVAQIRHKIEEDKYEDSLSMIQRDLDAIKHRSSYIVEALGRFERGFWRYQKSQLLRWLLLEIALPVVMGLAAIIAVVVSLFPFTSIFRWITSLCI